MNQQEEQYMLLIDGQVFQTTARDRGMGRYALCLLQALRRQTNRTMELVLSSHLPWTVQDEAELKELLPDISVRMLDLWTTEHHTIEQASAHNRSVLTAYMATQQADKTEYFIPSLFQEPIVAVFPEHARVKTLLFHDLIPFLYHDRYRSVMLYDNYLKRFKTLFEADIVFTNSQTVADDLSIYLGVANHKLCRIDGAAIRLDATVEKPSHLDMSAPFILMNTSDDPRKNNVRSVLGFEEFRRTTGSHMKLVLTSTIHRREQERLKAISSELIFTGNIPEKQLNWLYEHCELLLFTPESEGLGLPVLEAVEAGKKVVCSSIPVLREISPSSDTFYYCDHENSFSIARALENAINPEKQINTAAYKEVELYYTWDNSAIRMLEGLDGFVRPVEQKKPKLAIFTATPSGLSGVGLTAAALHPVLADYFDIDYYLEQGLSKASIRPNYLQYVAPSYPAQAFSAQRYGQYDAVVYHMGNGEYHLESIKNALYLPGYIIVHDTNLREAYRVLRETGMMADERVQLEESLDKVNAIKASNYYYSLANRQLGILTHSNYATKAMEEVLDTAVPVVKTGLPTNVPRNTNQHISERLVIGLAGAIADVKGLGVIEAIAEDPAFTNCDIRLFGFNHASKDKLDKLSNYSNVSIATNVSDYDFQTSFAKLDIFVNYRMIYKGETSNTTLEAMRQGVVTVVRDIGWFSELDDDVVVKVDSPEEAITCLRTLITDRAALRAIGERAKAYTAKTFTQEQYALALLELITHNQDGNPNDIVARQLRSGAIKRAAQLQTLLGVV